MENPGYPGLRAVLEASGTGVETVDVDAQGRWWLSRGQREADVGVADSLRVLARARGVAGSLSGIGVAVPGPVDAAGPT